MTNDYYFELCLWILEWTSGMDFVPFFKSVSILKTLSFLGGMGAVDTGRKYLTLLPTDHYTSMDAL